MSASDRNPKPRRSLHGRGVTAFLVLFSAAVLVYSGLVLYVDPKPDTSRLSWMLSLGLDKDQWKDLHVVISALFVVVALDHLSLNWRSLMHYLRGRAGRAIHLKRELALALMIVGISLAGSLARVPPFYTVVQIRHVVKDYLRHHH